MAKFAELKKRDLLPTSIEGVFIQDVPMAVINDMVKLEKQLAKKKDSDGLELVVWMFQELIRAEDGTKFDDVLTKEDLAQNLGIVQAKMIMSSVMEVLSSSGNV